MTGQGQPKEGRKQKTTSDHQAVSQPEPDDISCPACGENENLAGERQDELIQITCGRCETQWHRDPERRCPRCGAGDLYAAPVAVIEKSRGTQLSIVSTKSEYLCWDCDRDLIDAQRQSGTALMPDQLPTL